jgi:hypothetical protein
LLSTLNNNAKNIPNDFIDIDVLAEKAHSILNTLIYLLLTAVDDSGSSCCFIAILALFDYSRSPFTVNGFYSNTANPVAC